MGEYLGNYVEDATVVLTFNTRTAAGAPITLAGTPAVAIYKGDNTSQSTAGVTLTVDFDGVTGLHHVKIDTSADAFYATGQDYSIVLTTGTVDGTSVAGTVLGQFSIEHRWTDANIEEVDGSPVAASPEMPTAQEIWEYDMGDGRTPKQAMHALRNRVTRTGGTITVYDTDDTTPSWTATYTTDDTLEPIDEVDPS